jgi:hypothetical protein
MICHFDITPPSGEANLFLMVRIANMNFALDSTYNGKKIKEMSNEEKAQLVELFAAKGTKLNIEGFDYD